MSSPFHWLVSRDGYQLTGFFWGLTYGILLAEYLRYRRSSR